MDGDGDLDIVGSHSIADCLHWWENADGTGTNFLQHVIATNLDFVGSTSVADIDGDGVLDVIASKLSTPGRVSWWENVTSNGCTWVLHPIGSISPGIHFSPGAADIDGDGDEDVFATNLSYDSVAWWENCDGSGTTWVMHVVNQDFGWPHSASADDIDGDGDIDILSASHDHDEIVWWENASGMGTSWVEHLVVSNFTWAECAFSDDIDGDGDVDVVGVARADNEIAWFENSNQVGSAWVKHSLDSNFLQPISAYAADMNGDRSTDLLGTSYNGDELAWWENGTLIIEATAERLPQA